MDRMEMLSKLSKKQIGLLLLATMGNRRIPKEVRCKHKNVNVAKNVIIQLPLRDGCLRSENEMTISKRVNVTYCANPCCEFVLAMERA